MNCKVNHWGGAWLEEGQLPRKWLNQPIKHTPLQFPSVFLLLSHPTLATLMLVAIPVGSGTTMAELYYVWSTSGWGHRVARAYFVGWLVTEGGRADENTILKHMLGILMLTRREHYFWGVCFRKRKHFICTWEDWLSYTEKVKTLPWWLICRMDSKDTN